jgi:hypothetical protein
MTCCAAKCDFFEKKFQKYLVGENKVHIFAPALREKHTAKAGLSMKIVVFGCYISFDINRLIK